MPDKKFISLEEAISALEVECMDCDGDKIGDNSDFCEKCMVCRIKKRLEAIPAADVSIVEHATWEREDPNGANSFRGCWRCSKCRYPVNNVQKRCPNCGAVMPVGF